MNISKYLYPLDTECSNPQNVIAEEVYAINTEDNDYRVIVPMSGPFFAKDFSLKHATSKMPLFKGVDYEFTEPYIDIAAVGADLLYGGVVLLNNKLLGEFEITYHTIGGQYVMPHVGVVNYLVNHLNDPKGVHWNNIVDRLVQYAPDEHTYNWHDHQNTNHVSEAIDNITDAIGTASDNTDGVFTELAGRITQLDNLVTSTKFNEHIVNHADPHRVTPAQAHALDLNATAQNALAVYGKTLVELSDYCIAHGVNDQVLEDYLRRDGTNLVLKNLRISQSGCVIKNSGVTSELNFANDSLKMTCTGSAIVRADGRGIGTGYSRMTAGENELKVKSSQALDKEGLLLNDKVVLTAQNVHKYFEDIDQGSVMKIYYNNTSEVTFSGKGTVNDKLSITSTVKDATLREKGITTIGNTLSQSTTVAAGSNLTYTLGMKLDSIVPKTRKVGEKTLTQDLIFTKRDIGLSNVDNTHATAKPLSTKQIAELAKYSPKDHTHDFSNIGTLPVSDEDTIGIARLENNGQSTARPGALLTPFALKSLRDKTVALNERANSLLPIRLDIDQFGGTSYLPVPALGAYGAAGMAERPNQSFAAIVEDDGKIVALRNGMDMTTSGVFYWYADRGSNNYLLNEVSTSVQYSPIFVRASGRTVANIINCNDNCMLARLDNDQVCFIVQNHTMNDAKHNGSIVTLPAEFNVDHTTYPLIDRNDCYIIRTKMNDSEYSVEIFKFSLADAMANRAVTPSRVLLSGQAFGGNYRSNVTKFQFNNTGIVAANAASNAPLCVRNESKWSTAEITHNWGGDGYCENAFFGQVPGKLRIFHALTAYCAAGTADGWKYWRTSFWIDLNSRRVTCDSLAEWPMYYETNGLNARGMLYTAPGSQAIPGGGGNVKVRCVHSRGFNIGSSYYGNQGIPIMRLWTDKQGTQFSNAKFNVRGVQEYNSKYFQGTYGSPVQSNPRGLHCMYGKKLLGRNTADKYWLAEYNTAGYGSGMEGLGPTTNRKELTYDEYAKHKRIPSYWDGSKFYNKGVCFDGGLTGQPTRFDENGLTATYDIPSAAMTAISNKLKPVALQAAGLSSSSVRDYKACVWWMGNGRAFGVSSILHKDGANANLVCRVVVHKIDLVLDGNSIINANIGQLVYNNFLNKSGVNINDFVIWSMEGGVCYKTSDNKWVYQIVSHRFGYVGNSGAATISILEDGSTFSGHINYCYYYEPSGYIYVPELGGLTLVNSTSSAEYVQGRTLGRSMADWKGWDFGSRPRKAVIATRLPSGWVLYFTQPILLVMHNKAVVVPKSSFDLNALYPSDHANRTFYVYVTMDEGDQPSYMIDTTLYDDTRDRLYIGTVTTDGSKIVSINIFKAMRFGMFRELEDHMDDKRAHLLAGLTPESVGLDNVVDGILVDSLHEVPEGANKNDYYISGNVLDNIRDIKVDDFKVVSGSITHGATLPVPAGYTRDECSYFVTISGVNDTNGGMRGIHIKYDPTTFVVSMSIDSRLPWPSGTHTTITAKYWCVVKRK